MAAERAANTTDDDTTSELKFGKFWTKHERKQHLEVAKERKQKREERLKMRQEDETGSAAERVAMRETKKTSESLEKKRFSLQEENMKAAQNEILVSVMTV